MKINNTKTDYESFILILTFILTSNRNTKFIKRFNLVRSINKDITLSCIYLNKKPKVCNDY